MDILINANVACGPLNNIADLVADPHIQARNMIVEVSGHEKLGTVKYPNNPIKSSETQCLIGRPAPIRGQHTGEILQEFGFSLNEVENLKKNGIVK